MSDEKTDMFDIALAALQKAVTKELEKKARLGQYAVLCRDGQPVRVYPEELKKILGLEL